MRNTLALCVATSIPACAHAEAADCHLKPKEVVTRFVQQFYLEKKVREAFETWVDPGYKSANSNGMF